METIKFKSVELLPPMHTVFVKVVSVKMEDTIATPATNRTDKEMEFGKVIFANDYSLIGKIILVDPWRKTPLTINGSQYIQLTSEIGFTIVQDGGFKTEKVDK